ncbi:hypothetical protein KJ612_15975 [Myxococcota bacterium]|nr:hypothetical protein [Myxococcota bacterium]
MRNSLVHIMRRCTVLIAVFLLLATAVPSPARGNTFPAGSLIIPMDLTYQDYGMLQAYGLVYQLLSHGIPVTWAIAENKAQCVAPDPEAPEACWWSCDEWLVFGPCPYPSFAPDLARRARILFTDGTSPRELFEEIFHGYRGGAFLITSLDADFARPVIEAWNTPALWPYNPWARRKNFRVVSVHEAIEFIAVPNGSIKLFFPPHAALLADTGEARLAAILRAAGIPQTNGAPFPDAPCAPGACGPGTANPDLLSPETLFSEAGQVCLAASPSFSGTLLLDEQTHPKYAMLAASAWTAAQREAITCEGGPCDEAADSCFTTPVSFHGHRVLHHLNAFRDAGGVVLTLGEASYTMENVNGDAGWPFLDPEVPGHVLSSYFPFPDCPCANAGETCVPGGCVGQLWVPRDCCLPDDSHVHGAGLIPAPVVQLAPVSGSHGNGLPAFQYDGGFHPVPGPLGLFSRHGAALRSGTIWLVNDDGYAALANTGQVALADFTPGIDLPVSQNPDTQVSRIFLNALFSTPVVQESPPNVYANFSPSPGTCFEPSGSWQAEWKLEVQFWPEIPADELVVRTLLPAGLELLQCDREFSRDADGTIRWSLVDVDVLTQILCTVEHTRFLQFEFPLLVTARFGDYMFPTEGNAGTNLTVQYDYDADGYICDDPNPWNDCYCGDHDDDGVDDCDRRACVWDNDDYYDEYTHAQKHSICACTTGSRSGPGTGGFFLLVFLSGFVMLRRRLHA